MSASLVGSEMCIRDSPSVLRPQQFGTKAYEHHQAWQGDQGTAEGPQKACLLYTSDAADDM
eukprot:13188398-Alexandrium_andersonii.AAC.1